MKNKIIFLLVIFIISCVNNKKSYSGYWCNVEAYSYAASEDGKNDELIEFYEAEVDGIMYQVLHNSIKISYDKKEIQAPGAKLRISKIDGTKVFVQTENGYTGCLLITFLKPNVIEMSLLEAENDFFCDQSWFSLSEKDILHRCDTLN